MKATGIVRRVDDLGRFVIPKEIRRNLNIGEDEPMEIFTTNQGIFIQKASLDATPDIFKDNNSAVVPAQSTAKTESRKKVLMHDYGANEERYLSLTEDQIRLLDYFHDECGFDFRYEIVDEETFEEI